MAEESVRFDKAVLIDGLESAVRWTQAFRYIPEMGDYWDTLKEMERNCGADCDGHAVGCIERFWRMCGPNKPPVFLIVGNVPGGGHAWVGVEINGEEYWADPTPGYDPGVHPPSWWDRKPLYAYQFDGVTFSGKSQYQHG